jgi:serine/threonine protein kinase
VTDPSAVDDAQLWSWIDRDAPELERHLAAHPEAESRVAELRRAIGRLTAAAVVPERIGEYAILGVLGRGGMGCVYDAEQAHPRRRVALKILPSELANDPRHRRRFAREADALARLSHRGIATVFGAGESEDGTPYLAMQRIEGRPLDRYLEEEAPGRRERVVLIWKIADALAHAHDQGVVHRDLKPSNVLVDAGGEPVVVDFGIATILDDTIATDARTRTGSVLVGTLPYMSPEQIARGEVTPATDVHALGILLFEAMVGRLPRDVKDLSFVAAARVLSEDEPSWRGAALRGLHGDVRAICGKALELDPRRRYATAGDLAADLRRWLDGREVEASPPSSLRRSLRFVGRHYLATSLTALAILLALAITLGVRLPIPLVGGWWGEATPFDALRWQGDTPEVAVDGEWYRLVAIDDLSSAYLVGFCQQNGGASWRKRFSEDLVQVLNRLGHLGIGEVDLTLRHLASGEVIVRRGAALESERRRAIYLDRLAWPWRNVEHSSESRRVEFDGRRVDVLAIDGVPIERFPTTHSLYDAYCDVVGRSPGERVDLVLRDVATGETFERIAIPRRDERSLGGR